MGKHCPRYGCEINSEIKRAKHYSDIHLANRLLMSSYLVRPYYELPSGCSHARKWRQIMGAPLTRRRAEYEY